MNTNVSSSLSVEQRVEQKLAEHAPELLSAINLLSEIESKLNHLNNQYSIPFDLQEAQHLRQTLRDKSQAIQSWIEAMAETCEKQENLIQLCSALTLDIEVKDACGKPIDFKLNPSMIKFIEFQVDGSNEYDDDGGYSTYYCCNEILLELDSDVSVLTNPDVFFPPYSEEPAKLENNELFQRYMLRLQIQIEEALRKTVYLEYGMFNGCNRITQEELAMVNTNTPSYKLPSLIIPQ